jgi:hypothetical protein
LIASAALLACGGSAIADPDRGSEPGAAGTSGGGSGGARAGAHAKQPSASGGNGGDHDCPAALPWFSSEPCLDGTICSYVISSCTVADALCSGGSWVGHYNSIACGYSGAGGVAAAVGSPGLVAGAAGEVGEAGAMGIP